MCSICVSGAYRVKKRTLDPLELECETSDLGPVKDQKGLLTTESPLQLCDTVKGSGSRGKLF